NLLHTERTYRHAFICLHNLLHTERTYRHATGSKPNPTPYAVPMGRDEPFPTAQMSSREPWAVLDPGLFRSACRRGRVPPVIRA
ncbi:hypothetical protein, partial [Fulvivirga sedimenti]